MCEHNGLRVLCHYCRMVSPPTIDWAAVHKAIPEWKVEGLTPEQIRSRQEELLRLAKSKRPPVTPSTTTRTGQFAVTAKGLKPTKP
jgi:hypothetical protein